MKVIDEMTLELYLMYCKPQLLLSLNFQAEELIKMSH